MKKTTQNKSIILVFAMTIFSFGLNAQWSKIPSIYKGAFANDGAAAFTIGSKGYVCAGSASKNLYQFDTVTGVWSIAGLVPEGMGRAFSMSFVANGKAYIIGGDTAGYPVATVWQYDPNMQKGPWKRKADFPAGKRDAGVGFSINGAGYVGCGFDGGNVYGDLWKYNDANDTWTIQPGVPGDPIIFPSAFVVKNKAYIVGGGVPPSTTTETKQVSEFDPTSQKWTIKSSFGGAARQAAFAFGNGESGFVGGGQSGYTTTFTDMWQYNPVSDKWALVGNSPLFSPAWSSAFVIGNNAYVGIGAKFQGSALTGSDSFYKFKMPASKSGIKTESSDNGWQFYPNPANNVINIKGDINTEAKIFIYDMTGHLIITNRNVQHIDISDLPEGIYTIQIRWDGGISTQKFIKKQS
jgi:N-acetylneuraminic acid mutarotase